MLVYIAGSGAMGCTIGYHIQKNTDNEVILLDYWPDHIANINNNGLEVTGEVEDKIEIKAMKPEEATEKADLIIVMTKSMALESMMEAIKGIIGEDTQVLCLLNGMGHEEILKNYVDLANINMGVTVWAAGINGPGSIKITNKGTIEVQNIGDNDTKGEEIAGLLNEAGLNAQYSKDVMWSIWRKVMINGTVNSLSALLECTMGELVQNFSLEDMMLDLVREFVETGKAEGVELDYYDMLDYLMSTASSAASHYPSMYQDLIVNNRKTEIDYINGAVVRKAAKHGILVPANKLVTELIHAKEELKEAK